MEENVSLKESKLLVIKVKTGDALKETLQEKGLTAFRNGLAHSLFSV